MAAKSPTFEQAIDQLETIVDEIESGEAGLEESIKRYEVGMKLVARCRAILDSAEKKITELTANDDGELVEVELDEDETSP